eukprot:scaffold535_cov260-Pinguiococcus_pyrenoidosus.AAC.32
MLFLLPIFAKDVPHASSRCLLLLGHAISDEGEAKCSVLELVYGHVYDLLHAPAGVALPRDVLRRLENATPPPIWYEGHPRPPTYDERASKRQALTPLLFRPKQAPKQIWTS